MVYFLSSLTCTFADFIEIGGRGALFDSLDAILMLRELLRISTASAGNRDVCLRRLLLLRGLAFLSSISFADGFGG